MFNPLQFSGEVTSPKSNNLYDAELVKKVLFYHFKLRPSPFWSERVVSAVALANNIDTMYNQMLRDVGEDWEPTEVMSKKSVRPMPRDIAEWLMLGPGVNQPLEGWTSARQKFDKVLCAWYGEGWETQPEPNIDYEGLFVAYQHKLSIKKGK